ncbi:hypothetical protein NPIL_171641 [Nephila pilipes]|uniref:Protein kinase domain-containing protein n=1 Tax=Nephila pilipes TaxID=299642 RepID=A0A8X6MXN1_NEPPI|nr:hypothetical protein NPIL_171641 [Nephila pilipes]
MNNLSGSKKRKNERALPATHGALPSSSSDEKTVLMKDRCILASNGYSVGRKIDSGTFATVRYAEKNTSNGTLPLAVKVNIRNFSKYLLTKKLLQH